MVGHGLKVGDPVIYRKPKYTAKPGRRAVHISPEPLGECYSYEVDKFWAVAELDDSTRVVTLVTRGGKLHRVKLDDPRLRSPNWWERIRYQNRFPVPAALATADST